MMTDCPDHIKFTFAMSPEEREQAQKDSYELLTMAFAQAKQADLLILDEFFGALATGMLDQEQELSYLKKKPEGLEVVLTGRDPAPAFLSIADYEMCIRDRSSSDEKEDELSSSPSSEETAASDTKSEPIPPDPNNSIKIREVQFGASGEKYANFYLKNNAGAAINVPELLLRRPDIHVKKKGEPQVMIMTTHTCESYITEDLGYYPADFYPRTTDNQ